MLLRLQANTLAMFLLPAIPSTMGEEEDEEMVSFLTSAQNDDFPFLAKEFANFLCRKKYMYTIARNDLESSGGMDLEPVQKVLHLHLGKNKNTRVSLAASIITMCSVNEHICGSA